MSYMYLYYVILLACSCESTDNYSVNNHVCELMAKHDYYPFVCCRTYLNVVPVVSLAHCAAVLSVRVSVIKDMTASTCSTCYLF